MFAFESLPLTGAALITLPAFADNRGSFVKTFQDSFFRQGDIGFELKESYFSVSHKDVIRGMHFQLPPHDHAKIVFCPHGAILDVLVDLRRQSPTYGQYFAAELSAANHQAFYIPPGFAHGFKTLENDTITYYLVSSEHSRDHDAGIMYDSFGMDWACAAPVMSARDQEFPPLSAFDSPF
ncbi:dTDP-4-dehydrorhamnose 3,5-epimerase family protein [Taibaiella chishuiensis]|uniref:dTDP-4-dehydrorhamnose 3,5-epimerase n=1 Tax=Taibaiella chishuiensis TaxID=1434707 RepID=A0A2P8DD80_9BACT|nr:dTDP-4-dehydrorhamnose 3,5-epimerase family protein [Taibaiella chishuiensis]PSK95180.1 dTDP-4-dehydrorhamnose 3,5-epimerase [Taibaiella chishuiensis]